jgi:hypothetical protein
MPMVNFERPDSASEKAMIDAYNEVVGLDWTGFNELNVVICQFFCLSNKHSFSLVFALQQRETALV